MYGAAPPLSLAFLAASLRVMGQAAMNLRKQIRIAKPCEFETCSAPTKSIKGRRSFCRSQMTTALREVHIKAGWRPENRISPLHPAELLSPLSSPLLADPIMSPGIIAKRKKEGKSWPNDSVTLARGWVIFCRATTA